MRFDTTQRLAIEEASAVAKAAEAQKEKTRSGTKAAAERSAKLSRKSRKVGLKKVTTDTWRKTCENWAAITDKKTRKENMMAFILAESDYSADDLNGTSSSQKTRMLQKCKEMLKLYVEEKPLKGEPSLGS